MYKVINSYFSVKKVQIIRNTFLFIVVFLHILCICGCSSKKKQVYENHNSNYMPTENFVEDFYNNITIDVIDTQSSSSTGTVKVVIPDLEAIYLAHREEFSDNPTDEQIREILFENLNEFVIEKTFDSDLYKDGNNWKMQSMEQVDGFIAEMVDNYLTAVLANIQISDIVVDIEDMERILE